MASCTHPSVVLPAVSHPRLPRRRVHLDGRPTRDRSTHLFGHGFLRRIRLDGSLRTDVHGQCGGDHDVGRSRHRQEQRRCAHRRQGRVGPRCRRRFLHPTRIPAAPPWRWRRDVSRWIASMEMDTRAPWPETNPKKVDHVPTRNRGRWHGRPPRVTDGRPFGRRHRGGHPTSKRYRSHGQRYRWGRKRTRWESGEKVSMEGTDISMEKDKKGDGREEACRLGRRARRRFTEARTHAKLRPGFE